MFLAFCMVLISVVGPGFGDGLRWFGRGLDSEYKCAPVGGNFRQSGFGEGGELRVLVTCGWTGRKNAVRRLAGRRKGGNGRVLARLFHRNLVENGVFLARKCAKYVVFGVVWMGQRAGRGHSVGVRAVPPFSSTAANEKDGAPGVVVRERIQMPKELASRAGKKSALRTDELPRVHICAYNKRGFDERSRAGVRMG